jgi:tetratricopeptide (TPR) repeat protein
MSGVHPSRLWPLLTVLVVVIAGAAALESSARMRRERAVVVRVASDTAVSELTSESEAGEGSDSQLGLALGDAATGEHIRARELARRGEVDEAIELLEAALAKDSANAPLQGELGAWLLVARRPEEAVAHLHTATEIDPDDLRAALNLATALRRTDDLLGAEVLLRDLLRRRPGIIEAEIALGTVLRRQGRIDDAIDVLRGAADRGGNERRARSLTALGSALLEAGRDAEAAQAFTAAENWAPADVEVRLAAGRAYLRDGSPEAVRHALVTFEKAAAMAPDVAAVRALYGRALELVGRTDRAEASYRAALRLDPSYTYARRRLLRLALRGDDAVAARVQAERLLTDEPEEPGNYLLYGLALAGQGRTGDARRAYEEAIRRSTDDYPEAWFNLGKLERAAERYDAAVAAYERAVAARPGYVEALNNLGLVHAAAGDIRAAEAAYKRALAVDPSYASAWFNLARLSSSQGDTAAAIEALQSAIRAYPSYAEALLNLGVLYSRSGDLDAALATYERLVAARPRYAPGWFNMSIVLGKLDREEEEYAAVSRTVELDREHLPALRKLAKLERRRDNLSRAELLYLEVLDRQPTDDHARLGLAETYRRQERWSLCASAALQLVRAEVSAAMAERAGELNTYCRRKGGPKTTN